MKNRKTNPLKAQRNKLIYDEFKLRYNPGLKKLFLCADIGKKFFMSENAVIVVVDAMIKAEKKKK